METLSITQQFDLAIIVVLGALLGLAAIWSKRNISLSYFKYGLFVVSAGIVMSAIYKDSLVDVILFNDTSGAGRAYVIGVALIFAGIIAAIIHLVRKVFQKKL